jgi:hypothetical protein
MQPLLSPFGVILVQHSTLNRDRRHPSGDALIGDAVVHTVLISAEFNPALLTRLLSVLGLCGSAVAFTQPTSRKFCMDRRARPAT